MTLKTRILQYLESNPTAKPSEVAKSLGAVPSSVRRELSQIRARDDYKPKASSLADSILEAIREFGAGEKKSLSEVVTSLEPSQYDVTDLLQIANRKRVPQVSLQTLYWTIPAPASAIRSRLSELLARGIVKRTEAGNYAIEQATYTVEDLPRSNRKKGFRVWNEPDGNARCAVFDPKAKYVAKPMKKQRKIDNDRSYGLSKSNLESVPVLGLQVGKGYIVRDYDSNIPIDPSAIAIQRTSRGYHLYFEESRPGSGVGADEDYDRISRERGIYQERLFEKDGMPREKLIPLSERGMEFVAKHNEALIEAQKASISQRYGKR